MACLEHCDRTETDRGLVVGALVAARLPGRSAASTTSQAATPWQCWPWRHTPSLGRKLSLSKIASALRRGGRQRRIEEQAAGIQAALRSAQLVAPDVVSEAMGASVAALVAVIGEL